MIDIVARTPFQVRPAVDNPDEFIPFVVKQANDSLLVAEAEKLGPGQGPGRGRRGEQGQAAQDPLCLLRVRGPGRRRSPKRRRGRSTRPTPSITRSPRATRSPRSWWAPGRPPTRCWCACRAGEAFEDIARVRSRDPFTAPQGGDVGFLKVEDDPEFDGFLKTMQVGEKKAFRSLEGYVVLWLREYHTPRPATFEEARASVEKGVCCRARRTRRWRSGSPTSERPPTLSSMRMSWTRSSCRRRLAMQGSGQGSQEAQLRPRRRAASTAGWKSGSISRICLIRATAWSRLP